MQDFEKGGEVANPDVWGSYNSVMRRPRTFEESLRLWDEMSQWDLLEAALNEISEEACQTDEMSPGVIWYECTDGKIAEDCNQMLADCNAEDLLQSQIWHAAAYGNSFEKLDYAREKGVMGMAYIHPMDIRRYWLARNRRCIGFRWMGNKPDKEDIFELGNAQKFNRAELNLNQKATSSADMEQLWYPWDMMHIRRMYRSRMSEHGEPIFEAAQGIYKKLRMALDQMVVHRAQIQPDRYVVNIDVKDQVPVDQMRTVQKWKQSMRSKVAYGSGTNGPAGTVDEFKSYYNALALDTILWIAKPKDFNHTVEKLSGTTSIPDVYDIEMLTNLFFSIIGMPKAWIGLGGDSEGGPVSGKALLAQDIRFLRKIKSIRRPVVQAYTWLGYFHLMLKGVDISKVELKCKMSPIGGLEDQMKVELLAQQADLLEKLSSVMTQYGLPREAWIDTIFKKYLHLPDEIVDVFLTAPPIEAPQEESLKGKSSDRKKIMEDLIRKIGPDKDHIIVQLQDVLNGKAPTHNRRYRNEDDVLKATMLKENDVIVSGYGQLNPINEFKPVEAPMTTVTERLTESKGYRGAMDIHLKR